MTRAIGTPQPCYRQVKEVKDGVFVPARIHRTCHCTINGGDESMAHPWRDTCDRYPHLEAEINGRPTGVDWIWTSGEEIDEAEYLYRMAVFEHDRRHRPDSPEANPRKPIDFNTLPPPRF